MQANQHQPAPPPDDDDAPKSRLRFLIPGDVFTQLCVSLMQSSDALLEAARTILRTTNELDEGVRQEIASSLGRIHDCIDQQQAVLRAICDEGEISPATASVLS